MVVIMILHIRSKYTAVGRKEILCFFYMYFLEELLAIFLDSAIIPPSSDVYAVRPSSPSLLLEHVVDLSPARAVVCRHPHRVGVRNVLVPARQRLCRVPGRRGRHAHLSLGASPTLFSSDFLTSSRQAHLDAVTQILQGSSAVVGIIVGLIAIGTFKNAAGLSSATPTGLWVLQFIFNLACVVIYIVAQLLLVWRTLDDRWPIGDILFGTAFWVIGQVLLYGFSNQICDAVSHYLDGTFFHALCTLFAVMMGASARCPSLPRSSSRQSPTRAQVVHCPAVADAHSRLAVYKYWDSITKEDVRRLVPLDPPRPRRA